jgi:hypothetical protein
MAGQSNIFQDASDPPGYKKDVNPQYLDAQDIEKSLYGMDRNVARRPNSPMHIPSKPQRTFSHLEEARPPPASKSTILSTFMNFGLNLRPLASDTQSNKDPRRRGSVAAQSDKDINGGSSARTGKGGIPIISLIQRPRRPSVIIRNVEGPLYMDILIVTLTSDTLLFY